MKSFGGDKGNSVKRRDFLKLIGAISITPSILSAMPKKELTVAASNSVTSSTITDILDEYLEDDILNRMRNIINKTSYIDYIYPAPSSAFAAQGPAWQTNPPLIPSRSGAPPEPVGSSSSDRLDEPP